MVEYLYVGPVSREVLEAASLVSGQCDPKGRLRLCCSDGQVGPDSYTGIRLTDLLKHSHMHSERDHAGRAESIADAVKQWDKMDSTVMDGIHLHCFDVAAEEQACRLRDMCEERDVQIGPGEDDAFIMTLPKSPSDWEGWVSFPAGPRIAGGQNTGVIDEALVARFRHYYPKARLRLHNADFMSREQWRIAARLFDGINVAPMLGVVQSINYIAQATAQGLDCNAWLSYCVTDEHQLRRWQLDRRMWYHVGHYHFDQIAWREDVRDGVVAYLTGVIREIMKWL